MLRAYDNKEPWAEHLHSGKMREFTKEEQYRRMKVAELKQKCLELNLTVPRKSKKKNLIELLLNHTKESNTATAVSEIQTFGGNRE